MAGWSRRHLASTTASSAAREAPWPEVGAGACAASPMITIWSLCQAGTRGQVVGVVAGDLEPAGADEAGGRAAVGREQLEQLLLPLPGGGGPALGPAGLAAGDVGEPHGPAGG